MGQKGVAAVEHPGHGVALVGFQLVLRVHPGEGDVVAVVFAGPLGVKNSVISGAQVSAALRVFENPVPERLVNGLRFLLGNGSVLGIENTLSFGALIINPRIPLIQKVLKNDIGASALGAIGGMDAGIVPLVHALALHIPFACDFVVENIYLFMQIFRHLK